MDFEKRINPRLSKRITVEYLVMTGFGPGTFERTNSIDLSHGGMRIGLSRKLPQAQTVLECCLFLNGKPHWAISEIVWRGEDSLGVRFIAPDGDFRLALDEIFGKNQGHRESPYRTFSRNESDLPEKWMARTIRALDPHDKWIDRPHR